MKKAALILFFMIVFSPEAAAAAADEWSLNNVIKYNPENSSNYAKMIDYENISILASGIRATDSAAGAWFQSYPVDVGSDYILSGAFINLYATDTNSYAVLSVRDSENDALIQSRTFRQSGQIDLVNMFVKNVYLHAEIRGGGIQVLSYGLTRKPEIIITPDDLTIKPALLFYEENVLRMDFTLRYPAFIDVILFDKYGTIIDTIVRKEFFSEGDNFLYWEPSPASHRKLVSGTHHIYFKVLSTDGKQVELIQDFIFVKN